MAIRELVEAIEALVDALGVYIEDFREVNLIVVVLVLISYLSQ